MILDSRTHSYPKHHSRDELWTMIEILLEKVTPVQISAIPYLLRPNVCSAEVTKCDACALRLLWSSYA